MTNSRENSDVMARDDALISIRAELMVGKRKLNESSEIKNIFASFSCNLRFHRPRSEPLEAKFFLCFFWHKRKTFFRLRNFFFSCLMSLEVHSKRKLFPSRCSHISKLFLGNLVFHFTSTVKTGRAPCHEKKKTEKKLSARWWANKRLAKNLYAMRQMKKGKKKQSTH